MSDMMYQYPQTDTCDTLSPDQDYAPSIPRDTLTQVLVTDVLHRLANPTIVYQTVTTMATIDTQTVHVSPGIATNYEPATISLEIDSSYEVNYSAGGVGAQSEPTFVGESDLADGADLIENPKPQPTKAVQSKNSQNRHSIPKPKRPYNQAQPKYVNQFASVPVQVSVPKNSRPDITYLSQNAGASSDAGLKLQEKAEQLLAQSLVEIENYLTPKAKESVDRGSQPPSITYTAINTDSLNNTQDILDSLGQTASQLGTQTTLSIVSPLYPKEIITPYTPAQQLANTRHLFLPPQKKIPLGQIIAGSGTAVVVSAVYLSRRAPVKKSETNTSPITPADQVSSVMHSSVRLKQSLQVSNQAPINSVFHFSELPPAVTLLPLVTGLVCVATWLRKSGNTAKDRYLPNITLLQPFLVQNQQIQITHESDALSQADQLLSVLQNTKEPRLDIFTRWIRLLQAFLGINKNNSLVVLSVEPRYDLLEWIIKDLSAIFSNPKSASEFFDALSEEVRLCLMRLIGIIHPEVSLSSFVMAINNQNGGGLTANSISEVATTTAIVSPTGGESVESDNSSTADGVSEDPENVRSVRLLKGLKHLDLIEERLDGEIVLRSRHASRAFDILATTNGETVYGDTIFNYIPRFAKLGVEDFEIASRIIYFLYEMLGIMTVRNLTHFEVTSTNARMAHFLHRNIQLNGESAGKLLIEGGRAVGYHLQVDVETISLLRDHLRDTLVRDLPQRGYSMAECIIRNQQLSELLGSKRFITHISDSRDVMEITTNTEGGQNNDILATIEVGREVRFYSIMPKDSDNKPRGTDFEAVCRILIGFRFILQKMLETDTLSMNISVTNKKMALFLERELLDKHGESIGRASQKEDGNWKYTFTVAREKLQETITILNGQLIRSLDERGGLSIVDCLNQGVFPVRVEKTPDLITPEVQFQFEQNHIHLRMHTYVSEAQYLGDKDPTNEFMMGGVCDMVIWVFHNSQEVSNLPQYLELYRNISVEHYVAAVKFLKCYDIDVSAPEPFSNHYIINSEKVRMLLQGICANIYPQVNQVDGGYSPNAFLVLNSQRMRVLNHIKTDEMSDYIREDMPESSQLGYRKYAHAVDRLNNYPELQTQLLQLEFMDMLYKIDRVGHVGFYKMEALLSYLADILADDSGLHRPFQPFEMRHGDSISSRQTIQDHWILVETIIDQTISRLHPVQKQSVNTVINELSKMLNISLSCSIDISQQANILLCLIEFRNVFQNRFLEQDQADYIKLFQKLFALHRMHTPNLLEALVTYREVYMGSDEYQERRQYLLSTFEPAFLVRVVDNVGRDWDMILSIRHLPFRQDNEQAAGLSTDYFLNLCEVFGQNTLQVIRVLEVLLCRGYSFAVLTDVIGALGGLTDNNPNSISQILLKIIALLKRHAEYCDPLLLIEIFNLSPEHIVPVFDSIGKLFSNQLMNQPVNLWRVAYGEVYHRMGELATTIELVKKYGNDSAMIIEQYATIQRVSESMLSQNNLKCPSVIWTQNMILYTLDQLREKSGEFYTALNVTWLYTFIRGSQPQLATLFWGEAFIKNAIRRSAQFPVSQNVYILSLAFCMRYCSYFPMDGALIALTKILQLQDTISAIARLELLNWIAWMMPGVFRNTLRKYYEELLDTRKALPDKNFFRDKPQILSYIIQRLYSKWDSPSANATVENLIDVFFNSEDELIYTIRCIDIVHDLLVSDDTSTAGIISDLVQSLKLQQLDDLSDEYSAKLGLVILCISDSLTI
jgi:hypothetical protein